MVLSPLDPDRSRLVLADQDALDDVDEGRHPELLSAGLPAGSEFDRRARDEDRRVHRGRECSERRDQSLERDAFRFRGLPGLGVHGKGFEADYQQAGCGSDQRFDDHRCALQGKM